MSETSFPVNDLLRRKLQTSLTVASLTLCTASTLFIFLFGEKIGLQISLMVEGKLTAGFSRVFSPFILFIGILSFIAGAVIISFMVFVMMFQRVRDIGLMKAVGCPNDLIFGYFTTELLTVTFVGCFLGVVLGILADFASTSLFNSFGFQISQKSINFWFVLLVFVLFFALALIFGAKPILDTAKIEPAKAISPTYYFGLRKEPGFRVVSKSGFTIKIALRSLFRRKSATIRIVLCLSIIFVLVTVAVAGGVIADQTTKSWVEKAMGKDVVLIAHQEMCNQYKLLLSKFHEAEQDLLINYTDEKYLVSQVLLNQLGSIPEITGVDQRLVLEGLVREIPGYIFGPETASTTIIGNHRNGTSLIVGVEPGSVLNEWLVEGELLKGGEAWEAVIGDSLAHKMFSMPLNQSISLSDTYFDVIGVCLDPINNGNVTYVPLKTLQNITGISGPNIVMVKINSSSNRIEVLNQMRAEIKDIASEFAVFDLNEILDKNLSFLGYIWSTIMFLPLFSLVAASLCLIGYVMLSITEQHQEFGVLRAVGVKPKTIVRIVSEQSFITLLSSFGAGIPIGIILTLLILVPDPIVTGFTVLEIAGWLLIALAVLFILSLCPAIKFARKSILEIMNQP